MFPTAGNKDVPHDCHAQERFDIRVVRLRFGRVPEKDQELDLVLRDRGADLLVPSLGPFGGSWTSRTGPRFQDGAGRAGGMQGVMRQDSAVVACPGNQVLFRVVVRPSSNLLIASHGHVFVCHSGASISCRRVFRESRIDVFSGEQQA